MQSVLVATYGPRRGATFWAPELTKSELIKSQKLWRHTGRSRHLNQLRLDPCPPRPSWPFGFLSTSILYYLYYPRKGRSPQDRSMQTHHNFPVSAILYLSARTRKGTEFVKSKRTAIDQKGSLASLVLLLLECGGSPAHCWKRLRKPKPRQARHRRSTERKWSKEI